MYFRLNPPPSVLFSHRGGLPSPLASSPPPRSAHSVTPTVLPYRYYTQTTPSTTTQLLSRSGQLLWLLLNATPKTSAHGVTTIHNTAQHNTTRCNSEKTRTKQIRMTTHNTTRYTSEKTRTTQICRTIHNTTRYNGEQTRTTQIRAVFHPGKHDTCDNLNRSLLRIRVATRAHVSH